MSAQQFFRLQEQVESLRQHLLSLGVQLDDLSSSVHAHIADADAHTASLKATDNIAAQRGGRR